MFGFNLNFGGSAGRRARSSAPSSSEAYLTQAERAREAGDGSLAAHLYLAAFEKAQEDSESPSRRVVEGLRQAWITACESNERSLAEHIFEKLQPYSTADEQRNRARQLQRMALDRLEEFGFTPEAAQGMADLLADDLIDADSIMQIGDMTLAVGGLTPSSSAAKESHATLEHAAAETDDESASSASSASGASAMDEAHTVKDTSHRQKQASDTSNAVRKKIPLPSAKKTSAVQSDEPQKESDTDGAGDSEERITFADLIGYDKAIAQMRRRGIGLSDDEAFGQLVDLLDSRHGVSGIPQIDTILVRAAAREDANQFMLALAGELAGPLVRMSMDMTPQGMPVLSVMASPEFRLRPHFGHASFEGPGILMLEDVDDWGVPDLPSDIDPSITSMQLTRGAREVINFIRQAVENPAVAVIATASDITPLDGFFASLLDPIDEVSIGLPTRTERDAIWQHICTLHPSLRPIDREDLVTYSSHLTRIEIYEAARQSVEEAFRAGVRERRFVPVTRANVFEKLASYHPVESDEYRRLENAVIDSMQGEFERLDDLLDEEGGR